jgi:hypothetical protein
VVFLVLKQAVELEPELVPDLELEVVQDLVLEPEPERVGVVPVLGVEGNF